MSGGTDRAADRAGREARVQQGAEDAPEVYADTMISPYADSAEGVAVGTVHG